MTRSISRGALLCTCLAAACGDSRPASTDTASSPKQAATAATAIEPAATVPADVPAYYAAKISYIAAYEAKQDSAKPLPPGAERAVQDLEARLHAIIGSIDIKDASWTTTFEYIPVRGNEGGDEIDGLLTRVGDVRVAVSTAELANAWLRWHKAPFDDYRKALNTEDWLTHVFYDGAHVYSFGDIAAKASLAPDVFMAQAIAYAQDTGSPGPETLIIGINRGERIYLIRAPLEVSIPAPKECASPYSEDYRACFASHIAEHSDFARIVAQVQALRAMVPQ